jgi:asparagine synthase (glutamine-hydrolysing)
VCGITGVFNLNATQNAQFVIKTMTDALAHRGPNSEGFFTEGSKIALGHRRLSIIDLSTSANQPFEDNSGRYVLIFNGEIYNYQDIKPLLPEYNFKTTSDTEVILAAYIKWGKDCLQHLNGMFAFAIWDKKNESLFVARDRLGVKPFYYHYDGQTFLFASEMRALLHSGLVPRKIDRYAVRDFLVFQSVYAPYTIIKDIFQLMPGECATVSAKGFEKSLYWSIEKPSSDIEIPKDAQTAQKKVRELLTASIERRMISDVPLGAFLSGGIDSSAVVALMSEVSTQKVDTFTVAFHEEKFDESYFADIVSKKFNTHHTNIRLTPADFLKELPEALDAVDSPSGDGLNTYIVSKVTKQAGITVALSGLGGDELFAGYNYFSHFKRIHSSFPMYWKIPQGLRKPVVSLANLLLPNNPKNNRILQILKASEPSMAEIYSLFRLINSVKETKELLKDTDSSPLIIEKLLTDRKADTAKLPVLSQVTVAELLGYTLNVLLRDTDQFSMASALEVREPFFDFPLVEYVLDVPDAFKYDPSIPKSLLVKALHPLLPDEIVNRPKMGFSFPWKEWLLTDLRSFCEKNIDYLAKCGLFDEKAIKQEWALFLHTKGKKVAWVKIWQLVVLSHWLKKNQIEC